MVSFVNRAAGPAMLTAAMTSPRGSKIGAATHTPPISFSSNSEVQPTSRHSASTASRISGSVMVRCVEAGKVAEAVDRLSKMQRMIGKKRPPAGGRMIRRARARIGRHAQGLAALKALDDEAVGGAGKSEVHGLPRQGAKPDEVRARHTRDVEPALDRLAIAQMLQAQPVSAGLCVPLGETDIDERAHEIESCRLGKPGHHGEIAQRHPGARSHRVEKSLGAPDGLNACLDRKASTGPAPDSRSRASRAALTGSPSTKRQLACRRCALDARRDARMRRVRCRSISLNTCP